MTKKSASRILRDARKQDAERRLKDNTIWDDLNGTYNGCAQALGQHAGIAVMLSRKEVFPFLKDPVTLSENIRSLTGDLQAMNAELKEIHAQHAGKKGGSQNPDEVIHSIQIFEQYHLFLERHNAVIMPIAMHILEEFGQAEVAYNATIAETQQTTAQAQASDPAHDAPIDVAYKDVATTDVTN